MQKEKASARVSARSHLLATNYKADTCESPGEGVDQTLTCVNTGFSCYLLPHSQPQTPNSDGFIWSEDVDLALVLRSPTYRQSGESKLWVKATVCCGRLI